MYSNSKFIVKKEKYISEVCKTYRGVRQRDGLSPLLCNLNTNDLPNIFDYSITDPVSLEVRRLLYADDLILLSESENGLQSCLDNLNSYCNRWKLKINISKTKVIVFSKGKRKTDNLTFYIENKKLEVVGKYKYLGVIVSYNDNLKFAAEQLCNKGLKAVFSLRSKILDFDFSDMKLKLKLFDFLIRPIISYASEIWISDFTQNN
jgi:hypothetical protein